jgi:WS/DGAT/MGAT family acyltransferase
LLAAAVRRHVETVRDVPQLLSRLRASGAVKKKVGASAPVADYLQAPPTPFNDLPSGDRVCAFVTVSLARLKDLAHRLDATVNDVFAAACAGAARAYLLERGALPDRPLTASAPVSVPRTVHYGNAMSSWFLSLATDVADPVERFSAVRASLRAGRDVQEADPTLLADLQEHSRLYELIWWGLRRAERDGRRPMLNIVVSNVRGPGPLAWQGHPVVALRSLGPLTGRMGLNLTAWSYGDDFTVGIHSCRDMVPDPNRVGELLVAAIDELDDHSSR